jgi:hypothetical protein
LLIKGGHTRKIFTPQRLSISAIGKPLRVPLDQYEEKKECEMTSGSFESSQLFDLNQPFPSEECIRLDSIQTTTEQTSSQIQIDSNPNDFDSSSQKDHETLNIGSTSNISF